MNFKDIHLSVEINLKLRKNEIPLKLLVPSRIPNQSNISTS